MIIENLLPLVFIFLFVATIYSSVGFGGGSSYIAFLIFFGVSYQIAPTVALTCNLVVTAGTTFHFIKNKQLSLKYAAPFVIASIPLAFVGGMLRVQESFFLFILGITLLLAAIKMFLFQKNRFDQHAYEKKPPFIAALCLGGGIGFLSGIVAIGGGVFLTPILYFFKWGTPKKIAATAAFFIGVNSLAGLIGQFKKGVDLGEVLAYWPLVIVVFLGSQFGSFLIHRKFSQRIVAIFTAVLILVISLRILYKVIFASL